MKKPKGVKREVPANSRKTIRKLRRQEKKAHRKEYYMNKKKSKLEITANVPGKFVKRPADEGHNVDEPKKKKQNTQRSPKDIIKIERQKEQIQANRLKSEMEEQRKKILLKANEEEDKIIKKLEKQLGLTKSKNKKNFFADDGLDYLLEICDKTTSEQIVAAEKHLANIDEESDFDEDLAAVTGKKLNKNKTESKKGKLIDDLSVKEAITDDDLSNIDDDDESDDSISEPEEITSKGGNSVKVIKSKKNTKESQKNDIKEAKSISEEDEDEIFSDDEVSHLSEEDEISHLSDGDEESHSSNDEEPDLSCDDGEIKLPDDEKAVTENKPDVWEDIYGRKRDKEGNIIKEEKGVYIPPHLRNKDSISDKDLMQLKRQIKSVLNKLAGTNLHWACNSIEGLYSNNSRNSVNTAMVELWENATMGVSITPDRMMAEHTALVAVLHANVGSEVGAHFLEVLAKKFDNMMQVPQPVENKTLDNLVSCLAHLYSFKLYHAHLLYDLLLRLLQQLTEKNIECVLVALRCVGGVMRKDEPALLKDFIHEAQAKAATVKGESGSRIKFLLEVLMAVKNNNLTKIPNYDPSYTEALKKQIRSIIRKGNYITSLNIRLEDLLKADERGKWWVVGSAWEGDRPRDNKPISTPSLDAKLLELARKQRMNTDVRRSIFCVIMSAEDYMDAFEKLQHLGLKGQQEREIIHVLLACCLQEKTFNPFYAVLAQKLCDFDRKYQLAIQYSVWDKIKELDTLSKQCLMNLAQLLIHLIMEKGLALSVLKVIQFSDLNKSTVRFMRQILLAIILNEDLQACLEVFQRISKSPKLHMFRESLRLFVQHFLVKNAGKAGAVLSSDEMVKLKERAMEVDKILTMYENKLRL